jgi:hypothetical protein
MREKSCRRIPPSVESLGSAQHRPKFGREEITDRAVDGKADYFIATQLAMKSKGASRLA